jgi:hypothetical protein
MKWTVIYRPSAKSQLASLWMQAVDREAVARAANSADREFATAPLTAGESREGNQRILIEPPLAFLFDVNDQDRTVLVWSVTEWR